MRRVASKARGLYTAAKEIKFNTKRARRAKLTAGQDAATQEEYLKPVEQVEPPKERSRPATRSVTSGATAIGAGAGTSTSVLGKRRRAMGQNAITIHEDAQEKPNSQPKLRRMSANEHMQTVSSDEDMNEDQDGSSDSEDAVDESVVDDMRRLEESFTGISQKYRLINRIGEGQSFPHLAPLPPQSR